MPPPEKVGYEIRTLVEVNVDRTNATMVEQFRKRISEMPEVVSCYMVSGSVDYVLEVVAADLASYAAFMEGTLLKLRGVKDASSKVVFRTIKPLAPFAIG